MIGLTRLVIAVASLGVAAAGGCGGASRQAASPAHVVRPVPRALSEIEPQPLVAAVVALPAPAASPPPTLLVHVDASTDPRHKLPSDVRARLTAIVRETIASGAYATAWPGGLPRQAELAARGARAYIVASTVHEVEVKRTGRRASILCRVEIRISPWYGVDGGDAWEPTNGAVAGGTARATTGLRDEIVRLGVRDCVLELGEAVTAGKILPFLRGLDDRERHARQ